MKSPLVSIIIPSYNRSTYLARAIRCTQNQSFPAFEIIVVDDGSTDNTAEYIAQLQARDARIQYIKHPVKKGSQAARNTGIKAARGVWIAFQDSDDEWLPSSLEVRLTEAENHKVPVIYSECYIHHAGRDGRTLFGIPPLFGRVYKELLRAPAPMFQSLLVRANALKEIDYLDERIVSYQEWDTSIRLAKEHEFGFVKEPTFIYHRHSDETISGNPLRTAHGYEQIVQKHVEDMRRLLGARGMARHYSRIAWYYFRARQFRQVLLYSLMAARHFKLGKL